MNENDDRPARLKIAEFLRVIADSLEASGDDEVSMLIQYQQNVVQAEPLPGETAAVNFDDGSRTLFVQGSWLNKEVASLYARRVAAREIERMKEGL